MLADKEKLKSNKERNFVNVGFRLFVRKEQTQTSFEFLHNSHRNFDFDVRVAPRYIFGGDSQWGEVSPQSRRDKQG